MARFGAFVCEVCIGYKKVDDREKVRSTWEPYWLEIKVALAMAQSLVEIEKFLID